MKSNPSESTTAYFSVHVTCPTVYRGQIVSKAVCPTWCTYLYQEREKNWPPLENSSRSPLVNIKTNIFVFVFIMYSNHITCSYLKGNYKCQQMWPQNFFGSTKLKVELLVVTSSSIFNDLFVSHFYEINFILRLFGNG